MSSFDAFKASFKGDLVTPNDAGYETAIARWAKNAARKAAIIAFVKDSEDVARAILYARQAKLPIAIRGGGHNAAGASSSEGGLVIDLSRYLNSVTVDAEKKLGYVGGGALWETVDKAAIQHGLATVGGTVNHTGVGGLILGGGYGWLSGSHGLAVDNLVQATVVIADGSILTASESEHPDLFWGIRGAGSNFGVITEFVLKLHPQRRTVYCGKVIYSPDKLAALLDATQEWRKRGSSEKEGMIQVFARGPNGQPCIVLFLFYNGSEEEGRANFKAFLDLNPVADMAKEQPYEVVNSLQNDVAYPGQNVYMKGCFAPETYPRAILPHAFQRVVELSAAGTHNIALLLEYFPLAQANAVPDNATAYPRGLSSNVLCLVFAKEDSEEAFKYSRDVAHELTGMIAGKDTNNVGYGNYSPDSDALSTDGTVRASGAEANFGSNYKRLQEIKKKYDPELVFNKWFVITPAAA
ncbi:FAD-binding domain-containing protein [Lentinus tigrinus ALCF2SS1-7]|uniref:FAD-binding domain-containing protein n=1 Tax=Lentinus tigrinus ALCF2SS1-6 TaxID=1328759 RepID=A0A5C2STN2_9APHY|nr:FAD-binding domain-containing protein [Lentinus tigrinus ALCF2SS1-6]RPD80610.1 FAD-binding domain-containing protein [Lentinus tigrinus ALCF2SS1-7]